MNAAIDDDAFAPHIAKVSVSKRYVYLDNAAVAPICDPAAEGLRRYADEANLHGETKERAWARRAEEKRSFGASSCTSGGSARKTSWAWSKERA